MSEENFEDLLEKEPDNTDFEYVFKRLQEVKEYGLEVEVIVWALKAMKEEPTISVADAFERGCYEWDV